MFCLKEGEKTRNILKATATSILFACLGLRVLDSQIICETPKPSQTYFQDIERKG